MFRYRGKHGVHQEQVVRDRGAVAVLGRLLELPGKTLFQYEEGGLRRPVRAAELSAYIHETIGPFSSKDFRTWGGTLKAAEFLTRQGPLDDAQSAPRVLLRCVRSVAASLGNTAPVTRASYICPVIFDLYLSGIVLEDYASDEPEDGLSRSGRRCAGCWPARRPAVRCVRRRPAPGTCSPARHAVWRVFRRKVRNPIARSRMRTHVEVNHDFREIHSCIRDGGR